MSNRALQVGGIALLGGAGYYFYRAGGDPKVAQKKAEADAAKLSSTVKDQIPGTAKQAKKEGELSASEVGAKLDQYRRDASNELSKAENRLEQYRKDAANKLDKTAQDVQSNAKNAVDQFDKSVSEGASKAKSGISSWFGSEKK